MMWRAAGDKDKQRARSNAHPGWGRSMTMMKWNEKAAGLYDDKMIEKETEAAAAVDYEVADYNGVRVCMVAVMNRCVMV
jgi:hypothetical protein